MQRRWRPKTPQQFHERIGAAQVLRLALQTVVLGKGGQNIVYRAVQSSLARLVAIKIMLGGSHADEEERARFQREALAVAKLKHPRIVEI